MQSFTDVYMQLVGFLSGIFLLIATTSNKNFKSAETVNVKFGVYEFGDKGQ